MCSACVILDSFSCVAVGGLPGAVNCQWSLDIARIGTGTGTAKTPGTAELRLEQGFFCGFGFAVWNLLCNQENF